MTNRPDGIIKIQLYQVVNIIGAKGVDILPETLRVRPGEKSAQNVLKWDILQMYAKPKLKKFPADHVYSI